jgi:hypothetical protein
MRSLIKRVALTHYKAQAMPDTSRPGNILNLIGIYNKTFVVYPYFEGYCLQFGAKEQAISFTSVCNAKTYEAVRDYRVT